MGRKIRAIVEWRSAQSDLLFSARDLRWDMEILINNSDIALDLGYYEVQITAFKSGILLGKAIENIDYFKKFL